MFIAHNALMGTKISDELLLESDSLVVFAEQLLAIRKNQGLSREQAASVCNVSISFIRDAETQPGRCSLSKLLQVVNGLGLKMAVMGWQIEP